MTYDTDALVIKAQNTGENDRLVTLLTRKYGVIRAFANGARSPKNKNASATSLLCYADFTITKTAKGICIITSPYLREVAEDSEIESISTRCTSFKEDMWKSLCENLHTPIQTNDVSMCKLSLIIICIRKPCQIA